MRHGRGHCRAGHLVGGFAAGFFCPLAGQATAAHKASTLQAALTGTQASLGAIQAQNAALAAASSAAETQASAFTDSAAHQLDSLDAQTKAAIAMVDGIITATGINPKRAMRPQAALVLPPAQDHAALLRVDLTHLQALSAFLGEMPLAPPVEQMTMSSPFGYRPVPWTGPGRANSMSASTCAGPRARRSMPPPPALSVLPAARPAMARSSRSTMATASPPATRISTASWCSPAKRSGCTRKLGCWAIPAGARARICSTKRGSMARRKIPSIF